MMKVHIAVNMAADGQSSSFDEDILSGKLRNLCDEIENKLSVCRDDEIAELLECYDMAFRSGYNELPDDAYMMRQKCRLVRAWKSRDGHVDESAVFRMISGDVRFRSDTADRSFAEAYNLIMEKWLTTLVLHNSFPETSTYEMYQRLSMLMPLNLQSHLGKREHEMKRKWYETNKVADFSFLNTKILSGYRRFISSLPHEVIDFDEKMALESKIIKELSVRNDQDTYSREAYRMLLEFNEAMFADD